MSCASEIQAPWGEAVDVGQAVPGLAWGGTQASTSGELRGLTSGGGWSWWAHSQARRGLGHALSWGTRCCPPARPTAPTAALLLSPQPLQPPEPKSRPDTLPETHPRTLPRPYMLSPRHAGSPALPLGPVHPPGSSCSILPPAFLTLCRAAALLPASCRGSLGEGLRRGRGLAAMLRCFGACT